MALSAKEQELVSKLIVPGDFSAWLGAAVESIGQGSAVLTVKVRRDMLNAIGVCHGGVLFSLADTAVALAAHTRGRISMSIEGSASYIEAVNEGDDLKISCTETGLKNRLAYYRVSITKSDLTPVAAFQAVVFRTSKALP